MRTPNRQLRIPNAAVLVGNVKLEFEGWELGVGS